MSSQSPIQRSLGFLRTRGYTPAITEHWNHYAKVRQDLYGFIDILAIHTDHTLAVQTTVMSARAKRLEKILQEPYAYRWLQAYPHRRIELHAWRKLKTADSKWVVDVTEVRPQDLASGLT